MAKKPTKPAYGSVREEVEAFLFDEAALLDEWDLDSWLDLFAEDGSYLIPSLDAPDETPQSSVYLIADDRNRLGSRVKQLMGRHTWAENPPSRTRRLISNVRIREANGTEVKATANFAIYRMRHEMVDTYVGRYEHHFVRNGVGLRFKERKAILDLEALRPHGKVSFIV